MKKHALILALTFITGTAAYGMEQTTPATNAPVCNTEKLSSDQTKSIAAVLDEIISPLTLTPEQKNQLTKLIIEQAQQQPQDQTQTQSWFARNKKHLLIETTLCAVSLAMAVLWYLHNQKRSQEHKELLANQVSALQQAQGQYNQVQQANQGLQEELSKLQLENRKQQTSLIAYAQQIESLKEEFRKLAPRLEANASQHARSTSFNEQISRDK